MLFSLLLVLDIWNLILDCGFRDKVDQRLLYYWVQLVYYVLSLTVCKVF